MTTAPLPQIPDSVDVTPQSDTVTPATAQQPYLPADSTDSVVGYSSVVSPVVNRQPSAVINVVPKSLIEINQPVVKQVNIPRLEWNSNRNFLIENGLTGIVKTGTIQQQRTLSPIYSGTAKPAEIVARQRNLGSYDWLLGIFMLLIVLFIWIRIFYSKFFATLASSLLSFQISAKLFREKNVLLHRVSFVLDFIYVVVFSIFVFELVNYYGLSSSNMSSFNLFLLLLNIVMLYALFRIILLRLTGALFMTRSLFAEYSHNTLVVNKGMGIALFPVVIMAQYLPHNLVPIVLIIGILVFAIAFILKSFRGYQIIIRKDVLIFYLILYLCTLEILPLLLGYKFVTSLI